VRSVALRRGARVGGLQRPLHRLGGAHRGRLRAAFAR
jgi:hypothetical protein